MPLAPYNRRELFLEAIRTRDTSALPDPNNREELFLKDIADQVAAIPAGIPISVPAELSELLANLPEPHTHTERFYNDIIGALLVATTVTDTTPYISRETAGGLPVSGTAELKKKLGNTVCVNQLAKELTATNWTTSDGSISSGEAYIQPTSTWKGIGSNYDPGITVGHKYLVMITGRLAASGQNVTIGTQRFGMVNIGTLTSTSNQLLVGIFEQASADAYTTISFSNRIGVANFYLKDPKIIDLTLWFGSNDRIPSDLLAHPENWGRYYAGSLAYNAGTLESADGTVMRSIGRNQLPSGSFLAEVDTGSEVLRSAGAVADEKTPDGTITRRVGVVDLSQIQDRISYDARLGCWVVYLQTRRAKFPGNTETPNIQSNEELPIYYYGNKTNAVSINPNGYILYGNGSSDTKPTSTVYYELAHPVTEQGTDFNPGYAVEAGGTESWLQDQSTGVPQGHETEYKEFTT